MNSVLKTASLLRERANQPQATSVVLAARDAQALADAIWKLSAELNVLQAACDAGAILSRRIKDSSGRIRHADQIVDDAIKLLEG